MDLFFFFFKPGVYKSHQGKKKKDKVYQVEGFVVKIKNKIKAFSELVVLCLSTSV